MSRGPRHLLQVLACAALALASSSWAGEFVINPLRVTLDRTTRSSEIVVRNDDSTPLRMQIEAQAWSQDAQGTDQYGTAEGLIYFPRTMELAPGESRIVRVGVRGVPVSREDAYRLFIEELPPPAEADAQGQGTSLRIFLRVGVAVFVQPPQAERKGEVTSLAVRDRALAWSFVNAGNVHVRADQVEVTGYARDGRAIFTHAFQERYFLAGVSRTMRLELAPDVCAQLASVEALVVAERLDVKRRVDVAPADCR